MFTNHNLNIKPAFPVDGDGYEYNQRQDDDNYFEQPGKLFRLQSDDAKERIFTNTANAMDGVSEDVNIDIFVIVIKLIQNMVKVLPKH